MAHLYACSPASPPPPGRERSKAGSSAYLDRIVSATAAVAVLAPRTVSSVQPGVKHGEARMCAQHSRAAVRQPPRRASQRWHPVTQRYGVAPPLEVAASDVGRRAADDTPSPPPGDAALSPPPPRSSPPPQEQRRLEQHDTPYGTSATAAAPLTASVADVVRRLYSRPRWLVAVPLPSAGRRGEADASAAVRHPYDATEHPAAAPAATVVGDAARPRSAPATPRAAPPPPQPRESGAAAAASLAFAQNFLVEYEALSRRDLVIDFFVMYPSPPLLPTPAPVPPPVPPPAAVAQAPVRKPPPPSATTPSPPPSASAMPDEALQPRASRKGKRAARARPADLGEPRRFRLVFPGALWSFVLRHHRPLLARAMRRDAEAVLRPGECVDVLTLRADDAELEVLLAVQEWPGVAPRQQPTAASLSHSSFTGTWDVYKVVAFFLSRDGAPAASPHPPAALPPPPSYDAIAGTRLAGWQADEMPSAAASTRAASPAPELAPPPLPPPPPVLRKYQAASSAATAAAPAGPAASLPAEARVPLHFPTEAHAAVRRLTEEVAPQLRLALRRDAMYAVPGADQVHVELLQVRGDGLFAELLVRSTEGPLVAEGTTVVQAVEQSPFAETWDLLRTFVTPVSAAPIIIRDAAAASPAQGHSTTLARADQATMVSLSSLLGRKQAGAPPALDGILELTPRFSQEACAAEGGAGAGEASAGVRHPNDAERYADASRVHSPAGEARGAATASRRPSSLLPTSRRKGATTTPQRTAMLLSPPSHAGTSSPEQRATQHTQTDAEAAPRHATSVAEEAEEEERARREDVAQASAAFPGSTALLLYPAPSDAAASLVTGALQHSSPTADSDSAARQSASSLQAELRGAAAQLPTPSAERRPSQRPAAATLAQLDSGVLATVVEESAETLLGAMQESERSNLLGSLATTPRSRQSERPAAATQTQLESGVLPDAWQQSAATILGAMQESERSYAESVAGVTPLLPRAASTTGGRSATTPQWQRTPRDLSQSSASPRSRAHGLQAAHFTAAAPPHPTASSRHSSSLAAPGREQKSVATQVPSPPVAPEMSLSTPRLWSVLPRHASLSSTPERPASAAAQSAQRPPAEEEEPRGPLPVKPKSSVVLPKDCFSSGEPSFATEPGARLAQVSTPAPDADAASPRAATTSPADSPGLSEDVPAEVEVARLPHRPLGGPLADISLASLQVTEAAPALVEAVVLVAPPDPPVPTSQGTRLSFSLEGERWGPLLDEFPVLLRRALQADVEAVCGVPPAALERVTITCDDKLHAEVMVAAHVSLRPALMDPRSTARPWAASSKASTVVLQQQTPPGEMSHMWALYDRQSRRDMRPLHSPLQALITSIRETADAAMQRHAMGSASVRDASATAVTVNPVDDLVTPSAPARPRRPVPVFQLCLPGTQWGRLLAERGDDVTEAAVLDVGTLLASATAEATLEAMSVTDDGALCVDFAVPIAALPCGLSPPQFRWALDRLPLSHLRQLHDAAAAGAPTRLQLRRFFVADGLTEARVAEEADVVRSVFLAETCALLDTTDDAVEDLLLSGHLTVDVALRVPSPDLIDDWREAVAEHNYPELHDLLQELATTRAAPRPVAAAPLPGIPDVARSAVPTPPVAPVSTPAPQAAAPLLCEDAPLPAAVPAAEPAGREAVAAAPDAAPTEPEGPLAECETLPVDPTPPRRRSTPLLSASTLLVSPTASDSVPATSAAAAAATAATEASAHAVCVEGEAWVIVIEQCAELLREALECDAAASLAALRVTVQRVSTVPYARGAVFTFLLQRPATCKLRAVEDALQLCPLTAAWALFRRVAAAAAHAETTHVLRLDGAEWGRVVSAHAGAIAETFAWEALQCLRASEAVTAPVSVAVADVSADAAGLCIKYEVVSTAADATLDHSSVDDAVAAAPFPQLWSVYDALMLADNPFMHAKNADYIASRRQRHLSTAYDVVDSPCVRRYSPVAWSAALSSDPLESYLATVQPEQLLPGDADDATAAATGKAPAAVAEDQLEYERLCLQVALPALPPPPPAPAVVAIDAARPTLPARAPPVEPLQPQQLTAPLPAAAATATPSSAAEAVPSVSPAAVTRAVDVAPAPAAVAPPASPTPAAALPPQPTSAQPAVTQPPPTQPTTAAHAAAVQPTKPLPPPSPPTAVPQPAGSPPPAAAPRTAPTALAPPTHAASSAAVPTASTGEATTQRAGPSAAPQPPHHRAHAARKKAKRRDGALRRRSAESEAATAGPASVRSSSPSDGEGEAERGTDSAGSSGEDTVLDVFTTTAPPPQMVRFLPPAPVQLFTPPVVVPQLRQPHAVVARRAMPVWERGTATVIRIAGVPPPRPAVPPRTGKPAVRRVPSKVHLPVVMPDVAAPAFDPPGAGASANDPAPLPSPAASPSLQSRTKPGAQKRGDARPAKPRLDSTPSLKKTSPPRRPGSSTGGDESALGLPELVPTLQRSSSQKSTDSQPALPQLHPVSLSKVQAPTRGPASSARSNNAAGAPRRAYVVSMPVQLTSTRTDLGSQKPTETQPALPELRSSQLPNKPVSSRGLVSSARGDNAAVQPRRTYVVSMPVELVSSHTNADSQRSTDAQLMVPRLHPVPSFKKTTPPRRPGSSTRGDDVAELPGVDGAPELPELVPTRQRSSSQKSTDSQPALPQLRPSPLPKKATPTREPGASAREETAAPLRRADVVSLPETRGRSGADTVPQESTDAQPTVPRLHPVPSFKRTTPPRRPGSSTRGDGFAESVDRDGAPELPELVPTHQRSSSQKSTDSQPALPQLRPSPLPKKASPTREPGASAREETAAPLRRADVVSLPETRGRSGADTVPQESTDAQPMVPRLHPVPSFKKTTPPRRPGSSTRGDGVAELPRLDGAQEVAELASSRTDAESQRSTDSQPAVRHLRQSPFLKKPSPTRGPRASVRGETAAPLRRADVVSLPETRGRSGADTVPQESTDAQPTVPRLHPVPSFTKAAPLRWVRSSTRGEEAAQVPRLDGARPPPLVPPRVGPGGGVSAGATQLPVLRNVHSSAPIAVLDVRMTHAPITAEAVSARSTKPDSTAVHLPQLNAKRTAAPAAGSAVASRNTKVGPAGQRPAPQDVSLSGQTSSRRSRSPQMLTSTASSGPESVASGRASEQDGPAAPALQGASTKPPRRPSSAFVVVSVNDTSGLQAVQEDIDSIEAAMRSRYPRLERELIAATAATVPPGS